MIFSSPWLLLALPVVVAVALWTLLRPWRHVAVVGSLELWQKALDAMDRSARRRSRRVTASWLLLFAGALAAVLAAADPVYQARQPRRQIAIAPVPSAELAAGDAMKQLTAATSALLDRLAPDDEVQLLLPEIMGGNTSPMSVPEAHLRIAQLRAMPFAADELIPPAVGGPVQHTYYFAAAGAKLPAGPAISAVQVGAGGNAAIRSAGATTIDPDKAQLFVSYMLAAGNRAGSLLSVTGFGSDGKPIFTRGAPATAMRDGSHAAVADITPATALTAAFDEGGGAAVYLVRPQVRPRKVAMIGADLPLVRKYIKVDPTLELTASAAQADIVIAAGQDAPADKPALVINPAKDPPGWFRSDMLSAVELGKASVAADDPVMKNVDLAGVAVRRVTTWRLFADNPQSVALAGVDGQAFILRTLDETAPSPQSPRRIYVAFDIGERNTDFAMSPSFVIFLANATRWLAAGKAAPSAESADEYTFVTPLQAGPHDDWTAVAGGTPPGGADDKVSLPWPGIYRDKAGQLHAVSLVGLTLKPAPIAPLKAVEALPMPTPVEAIAPRELWPFLAVAAMLLWIAGWTLRIR